MNPENLNTGSFTDQNVTLRDLVDRYLRSWKWFVVGVLITCSLTYLALRYITPLYQSKSSIKIKDESSSGAISKLAVFEDMGMFMNQKSIVENEIEVLQSRNLLESVSKDLNLNVTYYQKGKSFIEDITSLFSSKPINKEIYFNNPISLNFLESDSIVSQKRSTFEITIKSLENFSFSELEQTSKSNQSFGNKISTKVGDIIITPNIEFCKNYIGKTILVEIKPISSSINYLKSVINISNIKKTDIINIYIKTEIEQKGIDILNSLIANYNGDARDEKNIISENTSEFISNRLQVVANELSDVDKSIEDYRTQNNIIDIESQAGINLQSDSENEARLIEARNQLSMVEAVESYINNQNEISILPENLGFSDPSLTSTTSKYNELVIRRNELLKSVNVAHPAVTNLDEQLLRLKSTIKQGLNNVKNSIQITIDGLNRQDAALNSKLFSAPKKQRELIDITRQQAVKESLYLFLLQKREEIAISLGIATVNAKVIDAPYGSGFPVFPNKTLTMLAALMLGLLVPFLLMYGYDIIDTKVHGRREIEKALDIPILGEIPHTSKKKKRIIAHNDRSGNAEAFRLVRTNLDFMLSNTKEKSKVVMVTSTIGGEGKSFITINLAKMLALSENKVLLLGLDLRAPTISDKLNLKKKTGVSHYITDSKVSLADITNQLPEVENVDLITAGVTPPNPAELLMSKRLEELFENVQGKYDYIIVDTSPLSLVTDTLLLNKFASMFIYVVRAEHLDSRMLKVPFSINKDKKLSKMAILINGTKTKHNNYGYGYGYGSDKSKPWYKRMFT